MDLRDYQKEALETLWGALMHSNSGLCVMPCGCGKTEVMISVVKRALERMPEFKCAVILNKISLVEQTERRFKKVVDSVGVYCGSLNRLELGRSVTVASIQSVHDIHIENLNLVILDESHNVNSEDGRFLEFITTHKSINPKFKILGFTATPFRTGAGPIYGKGLLFDRIDYKKDIKEMIEKGYLVPPRMKKVGAQFDVSQLKVQMGEFSQSQVNQLTEDEGKIREQVADAIPRMIGRKQVVWACSSIDHCELVNKVLIERLELSVRIHSKMNRDERKFSQDMFESGRARHLVFVTIVSEGYDHPPIDCVCLMRPIKSAVLYIQTVGRGLRLADSKSDLLVLDYGRVVETCGPLDDPNVDSGRNRKGIKEVKEQDESKEMKFCKKCFEYVPKQTKVCPVCETVLIESKISNLTVAPSMAEILSKSKSILGPPRFEKKVTAIDFDKYKSSQGNDCFRILYRCENSFSFLKTIETVPEYFVWNKNGGIFALKRRLLELEVEWKLSLDELIKSKPNKIPPRIVCYKDGKYTKVERLIFE